MKKNSFILFLISLLFASCQSEPEEFRTKIDLSGQWQFALDTSNIGEKEKWYKSDLTDIVALPGTTDSNKKGYLNKDTTTMHLNRIYTYEGAAWYQRKITITEEQKGKRFQLFLEQSKPSKIWIDDSYVGDSHLLQSPQIFDISDFLAPGEHTLTILVNNDLSLTPYGNVHIYSDDTQTNWNGILGQIYIETLPVTSISDLQVYPDIDKRKIDIELEVDNLDKRTEATIELFVKKTENGKESRLKTKKLTVALDSKINLSYELGDDCRLWDDYNQPLYELTVVLSTENENDSRTVPFGMREFAINGTQFKINKRTTFLRGKHEAAVFPLTGHVPMNEKEWERVFKIAQNYGINHYRFHSYCPPEAAFTAADRCGIFLQAELPFWGGLENDTVALMQLEEGKAMLRSYANHPSFVLFSHGNEIWSGHDRVEKNIIALEKYDSRPFYTMGCNNNIGFVAPRECSEFYVGARTPFANDTILTHTRLTHAFADSKDGGILNTQTPSTEVSFDYAVAHMDIPIISHEIGQYQIYPDYNEIEKYTGVLEARNLMVFRDRLEKAGMLDQDSIFQQASGHWSAFCYKAEMEAAFRTGGMAGFQLLDLQDFPGQGTALVGILDAFMDSKNVVTPETWKQSCNDVVLLAEFEKFCWTSNETFTSKLVVANYSNKNINGNIHWQLTKQDGNVFAKGTISNAIIPAGGLTNLDEITIDFSEITKAERFDLELAIEGTNYTNSYPFWVYPAKEEQIVQSDILVAQKLDKQTIEGLNSGQKVLYFPQTDDISEKSFPGLFPPEFWNYGMFKQISESVNKPVSPGTLGILTDPGHPVFKDFPTDFHTNWQWFSIVKASNSFILDNTPDNYRPIVQVIDNLERNHKLGLLFEFRIGEGKLLVCTSDLLKIIDKPEAAQLYQSLLNYVESKNFQPAYSLSTEELLELF